jgi:hypothetical protein
VAHEIAIINMKPTKDIAKIATPHSFAHGFTGRTGSA